jgi:carboxyl-terminal processing protease
VKPGRSFFLPATILFVAVMTSGWLFQRGVERESGAFYRSQLFDQVAELVTESYVDPVDEMDLYRSAIDGILEDLGDPNTAFLEASEYEGLSIRTEGEYGGVGLEVLERDGYVTVISPIPGTPGARAGIRAGDRIVEVDGVPIEDGSVERAVDRLRGRPDTEVELTVERPGVGSPIEFRLMRALIQVKSVPFETLLDDGVGYVPLQIFSESSPEEVRNGIESLQSEGLRSLILDLRGNPGGVLDGGVGVADLFLPAEQAIVETRGRATGQSETYSATGGDDFPELPMIVLVDERSASASEIVAGALQDNDRALVVGARSFGKGSVQSLFPLTGGNVLKLTTARWYTPVGRSIQKPASERFSLAEHGVLTTQGALAARPADDDRPTFQSVAGRELVGGGGITPDLTVLPDTLSTAEQEAVLRLYQDAGVFNTGLFNFVVRHASESTELQSDFAVTDAMLGALYESLRAEGLDIDRVTFDAARRFIRRQLESELALQELGEEQRFRRLAGDDRILQTALDLLRDAPDRATLLSRAPAGDDDVPNAPLGAQEASPGPVG